MRSIPFTLKIPEAQLEHLRRRLADARWPHPVGENGGWERGVPQDYARRLVTHWRTAFDWRAQEARLNRHPQFISTIDGQDVHYFWARSKEPKALPLMLLHGWPSCSIEFVGLIDRLTDPVSHGGQPEDAFHVVLPTTPGFGLSSPLSDHWDAMRTAKAYSELMRGLGYGAWGLHGGDVGADIAGEINHIDRNLVGVHFSTDVPSIIWLAGFTGADPATNPALSDTERETIVRLKERGADDGGYLEIQRTRPRTLGYLLNDSPVGQLAWMIEKFKSWTGDGARLPEEKVDLDHLLTIISLYWFTMSGATAADFLCTNLGAQRDWGRPSFAPVSMAVFGAVSGARTLQDPNRELAHWSEFASGGHFPAMEEPGLLVDDLRAFFRTLRWAGATSRRHREIAPTDVGLHYATFDSNESAKALLSISGQETDGPRHSADG
jgi:pimeloyl-ACP methyl ester carboxylesterase